MAGPLSKGELAAFRERLADLDDDTFRSVLIEVDRLLQDVLREAVQVFPDVAVGDGPMLVAWGQILQGRDALQALRDGRFAAWPHLEPLGWEDDVLEALDEAQSSRGLLVVDFLDVDRDDVDPQPIIWLSYGGHSQGRAPGVEGYSETMSRHIGQLQSSSAWHGWWTDLGDQR